MELTAPRRESRPCPSVMHARRELRRACARAKGRALMAADAAWNLAFLGIPSDEARAWCELEESWRPIGTGS